MNLPEDILGQSVFREFNLNDLAEIKLFFRLLDLKYVGETYKDIVRTLQNDNSVEEWLPWLLNQTDRKIKGIFLGTKMIGGAIVGFSGETASVGGIAQKGYEGKGLSHEVLIWAKEEAQIRGMHFLEATVHLLNPKKDLAISALEREGFKNSGEIKDGEIVFKYML